MTSRLRLATADRSRLRDGAARLNVVLDEQAVDRFADYATLLETWSARTNLIACGDARELVDRHFLDSLVVAELVADADTIVDLGSGAGFPGVALAIAAPSKRVILVEPRRRRASFLRELCRKVTRNAVVLAVRAEVREAPSDVLAGAVVSRAVWANAAIFDVAGPWLAPGGRLVWIRGADQATYPDPPDPFRPLLQKPYAIDRHRGRVDVFEAVAGQHP